MNPRYLLDTNALSESDKPQQNPGFVAWLDSTDLNDYHVSCLTLGEIQKGIALLSPTARQHSRLEQWLLDLREVLEGHIIELDTATALLWGKLFADAQTAGRKPALFDSLLAAQCLCHDLTLITRNSKDFEQFAGLKILNPWL